MNRRHPTLRLETSLSRSLSGSDRLVHSCGFDGDDDAARAQCYRIALGTELRQRDADPRRFGTAATATSNRIMLTSRIILPNNKIVIRTDMVLVFHTLRKNSSIY